MTGCMLSQALEIAESHPEESIRELAIVLVALCEDAEQRYHEISELANRQDEFAHRLRTLESRTEVQLMPS